MRRQEPKDPYAGLPTDELDEPLLPRWFVLLAVATVPVALVLFTVAFFGTGREATPVAERRPPPGAETTSAVGNLVAGDRAPMEHDGACEAVDDLQVAGTELDREVLGTALDALCEAPPEVRTRIAAVGDAGRTLRFAAFEATGVDVTAAKDVIYVNARYSQTEPRWIAPLVAYAAVTSTGDPAAAETALAARRAELATCEAVLEAPSRACEDAAALLDLEEPVRALRAAGFR